MRFDWNNLKLCNTADCWDEIYKVIQTMKEKKLFISSFSTQTDLSLINKCTGLLPGRHWGLKNVFTNWKMLTFRLLNKTNPFSFYLHDAEELDCVVLPVIEDLVAEHRAHWVVANVIGNSDATPENIKKY